VAHVNSVSTVAGFVSLLLFMQLGLPSYRLPSQVFLVIGSF
jgi:hypothetical protein